MKKSVLVTGATGALGSHVILRLRELGLSFESLDLRNSDLEENSSFEHVVHLAGVNRGADQEVEQGNIALAASLIRILDTLSNRPKTITFANSTKALRSDSAYAKGKEEAASLLNSWASGQLVTFRNLYLPNLIGEFGKPFQNMVGTTVIHCLATGTEMPAMSDARFELSTLSAAADAVCDFEKPELELETFGTSAAEVASVATQINESLKLGIDEFAGHPLGGTLWSMLVSSRFAENRVRRVERKSDHRGAFSELFKARALDQQVSIIDFEPGALRGNHFHRKLVEDFYLANGSVEVLFGVAWSNSSVTHRLVLEPGQSIRFPVGWWHALRDLTPSGSQVLVRGQRLFDATSPDTTPTGWVP